MVVDLGGGSTEVVLGDTSGVQAAYSTDIGCVRVTERCLPSDPPTAEQVSEATAFATTKLAEAFEAVPVEKAHTWVGVAGTMTTLAAIAQDLPEYDAEKVHLSRISFNQLFDVCERLIAMPRVDRAAFGRCIRGGWTSSAAERSSPRCWLKRSKPKPGSPNWLSANTTYSTASRCR